MSLSTPQSITLNSEATDHHRVLDDGLASEYRSIDGSTILKVSHQENKTRTRRMVRLDQVKTSADPITSESVQKSASVYIVIDEPDFGFSDADLTDLYGALAAWLSTNVAAVLQSRH